MALQVTRMLVPSEKYYCKCPYLMNMKGICVHNTGNRASAMSEASYMIRNDNYVSFHAVVDDYRVVETIPENRNAFHAGDGADGDGNRNYYAVEIAYSTGNSDLFSKSEKNAAYYIACKLKEHGWGIDKVKKHQDFSGKYCPHKTLDLGWQRFLNLIKSYLNESNNKKGVSTIRRLSPGSAHLYCDAPIYDKPGKGNKVIINGKKGDHITILDHGTSGVMIRYNSTVGFMECKYVMPDIKPNDKLRTVEDITIKIPKGTTLVSKDHGYLGNKVSVDCVVSAVYVEKIE